MVAALTCSPILATDARRWRGASDCARLCHDLASEVTSSSCCRELCTDGRKHIICTHQYVQIYKYIYSNVYVLSEKSADILASMAPSEKDKTEDESLSLSQSHATSFKPKVGAKTLQDTHIP